MSELKVNKISPQSGTAFTIGDSGDTFTVPSGATLTVAGTFTQTGAQTFDGGVDIDNFNINGTTIALSSGNMTIDAQGNDTDIIFKGTDGSADTTFLTIDGSAAGAATFNDKITAVGTSVFTNLDISGDIDVDGTTNLDVVDIDGAVNIAAATTMLGTLTIGVNDSGHDVILHGDTASANVTFDASADDLIFNGAAGLIVPDGQLTLGSTAVTATAAELNLIDGGTSRGTTAIADGDGLLINDAGTMRQTTVETLKTYIGGGITEFDMYRLTANITANTDPITSNLERVDDATFSKIGTGVSQSSGVWSFPSTGLWQVGAALQILPDVNDTVAVYLYATGDNSNYDQVLQINAKSGSGAQSGGKSDGFTLVNCTNTSNVKVKFTCGSFENSTSRITGNSDFNFSYFYFMRVGDSQ